MLITTTITTSIDISNPIEVYADPDKNLLNIVSSRFEGKCYSNYFIVKVKKILKRSQCSIHSANDVMGTVNVVLEILALVYDEGEVITGCTVINKDNNEIIIASGKNCAVCVISQKIFSTIKVDNIISVRVGKSLYSPGSEKISVNAVPFIPTQEAIAYYMNGEEIKEELLSDIREIIGIEEAAYETTKKDNTRGWKFFSDLFYPFKTEQKVAEKTKSVKKITGEKGYYIRDPRIPMYSDQIIYSTSPPDCKIIDNINSTAATLCLLKSYLEGMKIIREHTDIYTEQLMKTHLSLWATYNRLKV